jgi:prepilin-type N-terminal cleavage/methylation domain-containing protein
MKLRIANCELRMQPKRAAGRSAAHSSFEIRHSKFPAAFTLIELVLVLALLVVITSLAAPAMAKFIRGRALDSESRRLFALTHAAQSRAVSEGMPMVLWVDEKKSMYGLSAEMTSKTAAKSDQTDDPSGETLTLDATLQIAVQNPGLGAPITFNSLPAIRFLPDGTVDQDSPQTLQLTDAAGFSRWLLESRDRMGYEISDTKP